MTPEEEALLQAVCDAPYDAAPRLAYAAWMETQADRREQGEAIRLAVESAGKSLRTTTNFREKIRLMEIADRRRALALRDAAWKAEVLTIADECGLHQGLPASVTLTAEVFLQRAAELFKMAPIVHVKLTDARDHLEALLARPELERIRALDLSSLGLDDDDMITLANATTLKNLWYLDLSDNQITVAGVESLASSDNFPQLTHAVLDNNPGDVHERCGLEAAIVHVWMPPEGDRVEAVYGRVPWLHFPEACWTEYPPDPCGPPLS